MRELQFFDREQEHAIVWKRLPHWAQAGTLCFVTWRTADSLPKDVIVRLAGERRHVLASYGLSASGDWRREIAKLSAADRGRVHWQLFSAWDMELNQIVAESLRHFDGDRYELTDFVVMPNHVHLIAAFPSEELLFKQCESWKRFTAREIQKRLGRSGEFWQVDQFDHLVRSEADFAKYRGYIAENPAKARLKAGEYVHFSKKLS